MSYSIDLRERVVRFVETAGSKAEAARRYKVSRPIVYAWMARLQPVKPGPKGAHTIDMEALAKAVKTCPDALLDEHAAAFGVSKVGIWKALRRLGLTQKKRGSLPK